MKILQVHNYYQQSGGEDQVFAAECDLLEKRGHIVVQYLADNRSIDNISRFSAGLKTIWNRETFKKASGLIQREKPDVMHAHNTFPLISPAIYYAAARAGVPVVQTLHNYRLACPAATFFRDGHVCEECLGSFVPVKAIVHRCYRDSIPASAAVTAMLSTHRILGTWHRKVRTYIALSKFSRDKFIEAGLPADRIVVKPNSLAADPGVGLGHGGYALFAGRLADGKGIDVLLDAWRRLDGRIPLKIAGEGPLSDFVGREVSRLAAVQWLGHCERSRVLQLMREAAFLVFPSKYFENLPMTIIESFACGTPVLAPAWGATKELIVDGENGAYFAPGDPADLAKQVSLMLAEPERHRSMRRGARLSYEQNFTPERNFNLLMEIYAAAIQNPKTSSSILY